MSRADGSDGVDSRVVVGIRDDGFDHCPDVPTALIVDLHVAFRERDRGVAPAARPYLGLSGLEGQALDRVAVAGDTVDATHGRVTSSDVPALRSGAASIFHSQHCSGPDEGIGLSTFPNAQPVAYSAGRRILCP